MFQTPDPPQQLSVKLPSISGQDTMETESSLVPNVPSLCENCRKLDFSPAFAQGIPTAEEFNPEKSLISKLWPLSESCSLCKEIKHALRHSSLPSYKTLPSASLQALPLPSFTPPGGWEKYPNLKDIALIQPITDPTDLKSLHNLLSYLPARAHREGWISCHRTKVHPHILQPRPTSATFSIAIAKGWLSTCKSHHGNSCHWSLSFPGLVLIDCEDLQLRALSPQPPYLALSYVWAKKEHLSVEALNLRTVDGKLYLPHEDHLSRVIQDSITVTKSLGYRYLWIDKFCINQTDTDTQCYQIDNMDLIYRGAELNIIACAGKDERHGLPGVSTERNLYPPIELGDFTLTSIPPIIPMSQWETRAWTFQEELLSPRRLYFNKEQLVFRCNEMTCWEAQRGVELAEDAHGVLMYSQISLGFDTRYSLDKIPRQKESSLQALHIDPEKAVISHLESMWYLIQKYTRRNLTFDFDALRAISGIQRAFDVSESPLYYLQGLPVVPDQRPLGTSSLFCLFRSLCWEESIFFELRRRTYFPSWTWAGWTGPVNHELSTCGYATSEFEPNLKPTEIEYQEGYRLALDEVVVSLAKQRTRQLNQRMARPLAQSQRKCTTQNSLTDFTAPIAILFYGPIATKEYFSPTTGEWPYTSFVGIPLSNFPMFIDFADFWSGLADGTIGCILMHVSRHAREGVLEPYFSADILVVRWRGTVDAERIGLMSMRDISLSWDLRALLTEMEWRDIRLI